MARLVGLVTILVTLGGAIVWAGESQSRELERRLEKLQSRELERRLEKLRPRRLDHLFEKLHRTRDAVRAAELTAEIWIIWQTAGRWENVRLMEDGWRALRRGATAMALRKFNTVVRREPRWAEGWNKRATLYFMMRRYRQSIRDIAKVLELEPRHFGALAGLGMNYDVLGDRPRALEAWRRTLRANPHLEGAASRIRQLESELGHRPI